MLLLAHKFNRGEVNWIHENIDIDMSAQFISGKYAFLRRPTRVRQNGHIIDTPRLAETSATLSLHFAQNI